MCSRRLFTLETAEPVLSTFYKMFGRSLDNNIKMFYKHWLVLNILCVYCILFFLSRLLLNVFYYCCTVVSRGSFYNNIIHNVTTPNRFVEPAGVILTNK